MMNPATIDLHHLALVVGGQQAGAAAPAADAGTTVPSWVSNADILAGNEITRASNYEQSAGLFDKAAQLTRQRKNGVAWTVGTQAMSNLGQLATSPQ